MKKGRVVHTSTKLSLFLKLQEILHSSFLYDKTGNNDFFKSSRYRGIREVEVAPIRHCSTI